MNQAKEMGRLLRTFRTPQRHLRLGLVEATRLGGVSLCPIPTGCRILSFSSPASNGVRKGTRGFPFPKKPSADLKWKTGDRISSMVWQGLRKLSTGTFCMPKMGSRPRLHSPRPTRLGCFKRGALNPPLPFMSSMSSAFFPPPPP